MYLVDTNIFLEALLKQERWKEVESFLETADFDDAYQYSVAKKYDLQLISFDKDFKKTDVERKEPNEIVF